MQTVITTSEDRMKKSIANLKESFAGLRTGRASAALFDKIRVDCYGEKAPLNQVANISIPEARIIIIQPFDKGLINEIEKSIRSSDLSFNPSNDGKVIRITVPPLTEERRKELVKQAKNLAEQARVAVRNIRRDGNEALKKLQKNTEITEDEEKKTTNNLQKRTEEYVAEINKILSEKEKEIMEV
ncbi:MAG: ribosome recycling factor [Spirochaetaceae bacterium]|jgi:ribosome recycling factor|nr:ribosome recycling factor [Spirochaetaceae bacterium]